MNSMSVETSKLCDESDILYREAKTSEDIYYAMMFRYKVSRMIRHEKLESIISVR